VLGRQDRVLLRVLHPHDPLLRARVERRRLPRRPVLDKRWIVPATRRLYGGAASVDDRLQRGPRPGGGSLHLVLVLVGGGVMMIVRRSDPGDEVGVAGVDDLGGVLALPNDRAERDAAAHVEGHGQHAVVVGSRRRLAEAHGERVLRDVHLGEGPAGAEVLLPPGHEAGAPAVGRHGFRRQHGHGICRDVAAVHDRG